MKNVRLINAREKLSITAKLAAEFIGIDRNTYSGYENFGTYPNEENRRKVIDFYERWGVPLVEEEVFPEALKQLNKKSKCGPNTEIPIEQLVSLSDIDEEELPHVEPTAEHNIEAAELERRVVYVISKLPAEYQQIMRMRFGEDRTLEDVSRELGITREAVRQKECKALKQLRRQGLADILVVFHDRYQESMDDMSFTIYFPEWRPPAGFLGTGIKCRSEP